MTTETIMALDISRRACDVVAAPLDWDEDWSRVAHDVFGGALVGQDEMARTSLCERIGRQVQTFAARHKVSKAYIESYAYGVRNVSFAAPEVGMAVRLALMTAGIWFDIFPIGGARKLLTGSGRPPNAKDVVFETLRAAGCPFTSLDETDAMCGLNWAMSELGGYCFAINSGG